MMKNLLLLTTALVTTSTFANEKVLAKYECSFLKVEGELSSDFVRSNSSYNPSPGDPRGGFTIVDRYKPTFLESIFGYSDDKKVLALIPSDENTDTFTRSNPTETLETYGEMMLDGWRNSYTTVREYYSACVLDDEPCDVAYDIYSEAGVEYDFSKYGFRIVNKCTRVEI